MNKLFLSTFAVSLMLVSGPAPGQTDVVDDFLGLEKEVLPELKGEQGFTKTGLHGKVSWNVPVETALIDLPEPLKNQNYSIIPWEGMDPQEWLSISKWMLERKIKDTLPDWKIRLRKADHSELAGKVLQCKGICSVYRGSNKADVQHLSRIKEGDEINTGEDSIAWIFLMDGSLLKLSPRSSVSIQEINISNSEVFFLMRLNQGHMFWKPRYRKPAVPEFAPETAAYSLPVLVREANQEFYERLVFKSRSDEGNLAEVVNLEETAVELQYKKLNALKEENNRSANLPTRVMAVAPNGTIVSNEAPFDFVFLPGGDSFFKRRTVEEGGSAALHLRGYDSVEPVKIENDKWFEVSPDGKSFAQMTDVPGHLQILELLTKRIKSLELAAEIWTAKYTIPIMKDLSSPQELAIDHGYVLWGEELQKRLEYLHEYTRRIETTQLRSMNNLLTKIEGNGEKVSRELLPDHYQKPLNHYLLGLKNRYDRQKMRVREMNNLQYYVWILRDGKF